MGRRRYTSHQRWGIHLFAGLLFASVAACSGLSEVSPRKSVDREDGRDVTYDNGATIRIDWGEGVAHPAPLDLLPPIHGVQIASGEVAWPKRSTAFFAVYGEVGDDVDAVLSSYRFEMEDKGLVVSRGEAGGQTTLTAPKHDKIYLVRMDPRESGTLALGVGPQDSLARGLEANEPTTHAD